VQLFVERCAASGAPLAPSDADARTVAAICRRLDGVALAIELAAGRVATYGLEQTAALLGERLSLLWQGQRSAPARHQTLRATLDWSYGLLTEVERQVLRRLAAFAGDFTIEAAQAVATSRKIDQPHVLAAIESLVAKSMVANARVGDTIRYRLLDTTRTYALEASDDDEFAAAAARHASHYRKWLEQAGGRWSRLAHGAERAMHLSDIKNVRAALEWCFGDAGDLELGIALAAAAAPVFVAMSLFTESRRWSERAILALEAADHGSPEEMDLQAALGVSLMFLKGQGEAAWIALNKSLGIATSRYDAVAQLKVMAPLVMFRLRTGDFRAALECGRRASVLSAELAEPGAVALAHSLLGISLTHTGDLAAARVELEAAQRGRDLRRETSYLGFDGHDLAGVFLARTLWLQGHPDQALACVRRTVDQALAVDHPVTLSIALVWAVSVYLWVGDLETAEAHIERFIARAETHSLGPYHAVGRGYKGQLAVRKGNWARGVESLESALADLHAVRYELLTTAFGISIAEGLAALRRFDEAIAHVDEAIRMVEANGDASYMPELLRVKGNVLLAMDRQRDGEANLVQALELSRGQAAVAWELRTATDLAAHWSALGERGRARALLEPVFERFREGQETADVRAAARLLASLR
jgi:predicted ATPase